jgi:hypothetical protein
VTSKTFDIVISNKSRGSGKEEGQIPYTALLH